MLIVVAILLLVFVLSPALGIAVLALAIVFEGLEVVFWRRFLRRYRVATGAEGMVGEAGVVTERCAPNGTVRLRGEIWKARCEAGAGVGHRVRVTAVDGLTLVVEPEGGSVAVQMPRPSPDAPRPRTEKGPVKGPSGSEGRTTR